MCKLCSFIYRNSSQLTLIIFTDCALPSGAVKSNLGHLEGTSGLAGVVKTILALERRIIPPNTNFQTLNSQIDADFFNLKV